MATQEIYVLNKRLKLLHSEKGFKTSIDSVLLAASCPAKAAEHILDMGCGVGGAGLCVLKRIEGVKLTGVEIQEDHVALARENAVANGFGDQCDFIHSDIREYRNERAFDHVICNPPYLEGGAHLRSPDEEKAIAMGHASTDIDVKDWVDTAYFCLKSKGSMSMIHRADQTDAIIRAMGKRFGAIEVFPLWSKAGDSARRVVVRAMKDRRSPMMLHSGLVVHQENKEYTDEAQEVFRNMKALF